MVVRIILAGKCGSGKSSVGNMLLQGDIKASGNEFEIGKSLVGSTYECKRVERGSFEVIDTVGLGEPLNGTVPDKEAQRMLVNIVRKIRCPVNYIFFVISANDKYASLDAAIFKTVKYMFEGVEDNIVLVVTSASATYLETNRAFLEERYGKIAMISVDFQSVDESDADQERINIRKRKASYEHLMASLESLKYAAVEPKYVSMTSAEIGKRVANIIGHTIAAPFFEAAGAVVIPIRLILCSISQIADRATRDNPEEGIKAVAKKQVAKLPENVRHRMEKLLAQEAQLDAGAVDYGPDLIRFKKPECREPVSKKRDPLEYMNKVEGKSHGPVLWPWLEDASLAHTLCSDQGVQLTVEDQYREAVRSAMPTIGSNLGGNIGVISVIEITSQVQVTANVGALARVLHLKNSQEHQIHEQLKKKKVTIQYSNDWKENDVKALLSYIITKEHRMNMVDEVVVYNYLSQVLHVYKTHGELGIELVFVASNVDPAYFTSEDERGYKIYDEGTHYRIARTGEDVLMACALDGTQHNIYSQECWRWAMKHVCPQNNKGVVTQWEFPGTKHKYMITTLGLILGMFACQYKQLFSLAALCLKDSGTKLPFVHISPVRLLQIQDPSDINQTVTRVIVGKGNSVTSKLLIS